MIPAPLGTHVMIDLYGAVDPGEGVERILQEVARLARCQVLDVAQHVFENGGRTRLLLLSKSHTSVHTWPEYRYLAFDLFSCETLSKDQVQAVVDVVKGSIPHNRCVVRVVGRGLSV